MLFGFLLLFGHAGIFLGIGLQVYVVDELDLCLLANRHVLLSFLQFVATVRIELLVKAGFQLSDFHLGWNNLVHQIFERHVDDFELPEKILDSVKRKLLQHIFRNLASA